jgi:CHAT domain-containing protein
MGLGYRLCFTISLLLAVAAPGGRTEDLHPEATRLLRQADQYYNLESPTTETDSLAEELYRKAASLFPRDKEFAPEIFRCYLNAAILKQTYGEQNEALALYRDALNLPVQFQLSDSLLFHPNLFSGNAHYYLNHFDSALYYYEAAEEILRRYPRLNDGERLFNSFGAIYFEAGNYTQSANYFNQALKMVRERDPENLFAVYSFESNLATSLRKLEWYDSAAVLYRQLLPLGINTGEIHINLGIIFLDQQQPDSALFYFNLADAAEQQNSNALLLSKARAYYLKNEPEASLRLLDEILSPADGDLKDTQRGRAWLYKGMIREMQGDFQQALQCYQQSIIQLEYDFNDTSVYANPQSFTEGFSPLSLFESVYQKAGCFAKLYSASGNPAHAEAALSTFESAFKLARFIRNSLDNEEARLFLGRKILPAYQSGVEFVLQLNEAAPHDSLVWKAFEWAESSKANTLFIQARESDIRHFSGIPDSLLAEEQDLRFHISRLMLQMDESLDSAAMAGIRTELVESRLKLSRVHDRLNEYPSYFGRKFAEDLIDRRELSASISKHRSLLLTYFHSGNRLHGFSYNGKEISTVSIPDDQYMAGLQMLLDELTSREAGRDYRGDSISVQLYRELVAPLILRNNDVRTLLIIPHEDLRRLPFEALRVTDEQTIGEKFATAYQYSVYFMKGEDDSRRNNGEPLSAAPFAVKGSAASSSGALPYSAEELKALRGKKLLNEEATKENFLSLVGDATLIHLATHSLASNDHPLDSYIEFYPAHADDDSNRLYAHEIYNLPLQKVELAFLSSCESGGGQRHQGEGILSLSRAFVIAGCSNMIISLWKAEDKPTAYLSSRFYHYLGKGHAPPEALRRARVDLLEDASLAQFHSPRYWSHLIYIGTPGVNRPESKPALLIVLAVLLMAGTTYYFMRKKKAISANQKLLIPGEESEP